MEKPESIAQLFNQTIFRIPHYQRGYAWEEEQLETFWDDMMNIPPNTFHYTGMLTLRESTEEDKENLRFSEKALCHELGYRVFEVIDGQQRLTTALILIASLIACANKHGLDEINGLSIDRIREKYLYWSSNKDVDPALLFDYKDGKSDSSQCLRRHVLSLPVMGDYEDSFYTRNLRSAKKYFEDNLEDVWSMEGADGLRFVFRNLTTGLVFLKFPMDECFNEYMAFETMNNRGKKLSNLELLKNRLMYLSTLLNVHPGQCKELRDKINDAWSHVYRYLGKNAKRTLKDDEFLRGHWIAYYGYSKSGFENNLLRERFSPNNVYVRRSTARVESDNSSNLGFDSDGEAFEEESIFEETDNPTISGLSYKDINDYVVSLNSFVEAWYTTYFPDSIESDELKEWLKKTHRIYPGPFRPMIATIVGSEEQDDIKIRALKAIERYIFLHYRIGSRRTNYQNTHIWRRTHALYVGSCSLLELSKELEGACNAEAPRAIGHFCGKIDELFQKENGYYSWASKMYFLYEYEYDLRKRNYRGQKDLDWDAFTTSSKENDTVEHILPQHPDSDDPAWKEPFSKYWEEPDKMHCLKHSIGNLLPLPQTLNSKFRNYGYLKKRNMEGIGYLFGCKSEIEVANKYETEWTPRTIYERSVDLVRFLFRRWGIPEEQETLERLVHLDFVCTENTLKEQ